MTSAPLTDAERRRVLEFVAFNQKYNRLAYFEPYPRQAEFVAAGKNKRERLLMAANRVGKTEVGAYEAAVHLTGRYPPGWAGKTFEHPIKMWVCGQTASAVRDVCQAKLMGPPGVVDMAGTGMLPKETIVDTSNQRGVTDTMDTIQVRHVSGGISTATLKSYEQGREKFQGAGLDAIWFDEEPPLDIYSEGLTRIGERRGIAWMTFTPLKGPSAVVLRFTDEPSPARAIVSMTLEDIPPNGHISPQARAEIVAGYLPHEREARSRGIPMLGEGRIFTTPEEAITEPLIEHIPAYWRKLWGIDFGIGHPFAAVLCLWDRDNDVIHVHHTIRMSDAISLAHVHAIKRIGGNVPVAWPQDGWQRDVHSGEVVAATYRKLGAFMLDDHATWEGGGVSTEAGLHEWDEREKTGRLKVANHLSDWLEERRMYHRKDGKIVRLKDDLMSATRMVLMSKRYARAVALGPGAASRRQDGPLMASGLDFPLH